MFSFNLSSIKNCQNLPVTVGRMKERVTPWGRNSPEHSQVLGRFKMRPRLENGCRSSYVLFKRHSLPRKEVICQNPSSPRGSLHTPDEDEVFVAQAGNTRSESFSLPPSPSRHLHKPYWKSVQRLHFAFVKTFFCWEFEEVIYVMSSAREPWRSALFHASLSCRTVAKPNMQEMIEYRVQITAIRPWMFFKSL